MLLHTQHHCWGITMHIKILGIIFEDFVNYKKPSMTIEFPYCTFKCNKDANMEVCQNMILKDQPLIDIPVMDIAQKYIDNPITKAIVYQGLEPFDSEEIYKLTSGLRCMTNDDIVIYTGYTEEELKMSGRLDRIMDEANTNLIIKFGRFIPNGTKHMDEILGVELASENQYAKKLC